MRDQAEATCTQPTHSYKLRCRPQGQSKLELKKERKARGPTLAYSDNGTVAVSTPSPSQRKSHTPQCKLSAVIDMIRIRRSDDDWRDVEKDDEGVIGME